MKLGKKSRRVGWPAEANLCQVKIFQPEDCPSEVGGEAPDHPQAKVSSSNVAVSDGCPALSFGSYCNPLIPWRTPPQFDLRFKCHVAAGEESEEVEVQRERVSRVLEAVYPHFSAIPPSPSISSDVEDKHFDDRHTPVIPVIAIETAAEMDFPYDKTALPNISTNSQPAKLPQSPSPSEILDIPQSEPLLSPESSKSEKSDRTLFQDLGDTVIAAAAAATAIMKSKESGSLIDPELLIKLLSNPKMTEKLINEGGLASNTTTGASGLKMVESSAPNPSSKHSFLTKKAPIENFKPANPRIEAIHRPSRAKDSPAAPSRTRGNVANTETGPPSAQKEVEQSVHFLSSTHVSFVQKSTGKYIQPGSAGNETLPRPRNQPLAVNAEMRTGLGAKQVTTSIPFPSSMSHLPSKKSLNEHCQTADAGNTRVLKASDTLSSLTPNVLSKKSTGKHILLADNKQVAVSRPVKQAPATSIETGTGSRLNTVAALVPSLSTNPDFRSKKSMSEHSQPAIFRDSLKPWLLKPTVSASFRAGTGFGPKRVTPSLPSPSALSDFSKKSAREQGSLLETSFPEPIMEKQPHSFSRMQAESMVDQLDIAYRAPHLGTPPLLGSPTISKSFLAMESHADQASRLKKLIDEHGSHDCAGNKHVSGIPTSSKAHVENLKKLIKDYGCLENLENSVPGALHPSFPLPTLSSGMVEPLRVKFQSTELLPTALCASPISLTTTSVSLPKDTNYLKSLIKQHGEEKDRQDDALSQYGISQNYLQSKESARKYKKPCKFYNSSKGCRNGSGCSYLHDVPERGKSDFVLEAPLAKRMKLRGEFSGRK